MMIDSPKGTLCEQPSPDILIFDPPPQSIRRFRAVHRLAIALAAIYFAAASILFVLASILLFYVMLRFQINGVNQPSIVVVSGLFAICVSIFNSLTVYILFKINKPVLVQSCIFDRHAGELLIRQYNLFDRHQKTVRIPLNNIVDIQVRNCQILMANDPSVISLIAISLMMKQSSKPVYIFQQVSYKEMSTSTVASLLEAVVTIREFLNLSSEPSYLIVKPLKWYQILFAAPISNELIRSINQNNYQLIYNLQSRYLNEKVSWKFDAIAQKIEIESQTLIGNRSKHITRSEVKFIAIKTEFLPLEIPIHKLLRFAHRRQYQKQYSAILMPSDLAKNKPQQGYWRIFTSTDLSLVCDLVDRVQAHLNLPLDELRATESIKLEQIGAVK